MMDTLRMDLRHALRGLRRDVGFTIVTTLSFAVGVGAVTTAFAVVDAIEFRPLPYASPDELVVLAETGRTTAEACSSCLSSSRAVRLWQAETRALRDVAVMEPTGARWYDGDRAERLLTGDVSTNFLSVLGVRPLLGRSFTAAETESDGAPVVLLAYDFWRTRFGGAPTVVGRKLELATARGRARYTVIGVMPQTFRFLDNQLWLPLAQSFGDGGVDDDRRYVAVGRLAPAASRAAAGAELRTLAAGLAAEFPAEYGEWTATALPLREWLLQARPNVGRGRFLLLGVTAFVLLVAALNVASLSLARARTRFHEAGVRSALGVTRSRLVRQFLTEALTVAALGGALGLAIAASGVGLAGQALSLADAGFAMQLDTRVLTFAMLATALAGVGAGLVPAWYGARDGVFALLGQRGGQDTPHGVRLQTGLGVVEIACSLVLLTGGGLLGKELLRLQEREPGFDPSGLYLVSIARPEAAEANDQRVFAQLARSELATTPGVVQIGLTGQPPRRVPIRLEPTTAEPIPRDDSPMVMLADSAFFATVPIAAVRGRRFTTADRFGSPPVAVVNEAAAAGLWPDRDALGRYLVMGDSVRELVQVIGVVRDAKVFNAPLKSPTPPIVYRPFDQHPTSYPALVVRAAGSAGQVVPALRRVVAQLTHAPAEPSAVASLAEMQRREIAQERLHALSSTLAITLHSTLPL